MAYNGDYVTVAPDGKERFIPGTGGKTVPAGAQVQNPPVLKPADYVAVGPDGKERWVTGKQRKSGIPPGFAPPGGGYPSGPTPYSGYGFYPPVPELVQGPGGLNQGPLPPPRGPGLKGLFQRPTSRSGSRFGAAPRPEPGYGGYGQGGYGAQPSYAVNTGNPAPMYSRTSPGFGAGYGSSLNGGYVSPLTGGCSAFTPLAPSILDSGYGAEQIYGGFDQMYNAGLMGGGCGAAPTYTSGFVGSSSFNQAYNAPACGSCDPCSATPFPSGAPYSGGMY